MNLKIIVNTMLVVLSLVLLTQTGLAKNTGIIESPDGGSFNMEITVFDDANLSVGKTAQVVLSVSNFAPDEKRLFFIWWNDEQESGNGFYRVDLPSWGAFHTDEKYLIQKAGKHKITLSVCVNPPFSGNCTYVGETSIEFDVSENNTYAQKDVAIDFNPLRSGYDNQSEGFMRSIQWHPLLEDMDLSVSGRNIENDINNRVPSGETVDYRFTIKNREVKRNLTITWGDDTELGELGNESVTLDPEMRFSHTGSYRPRASGIHYFRVRLTHDNGSWIEDNVTASYERSYRFVVIEPSKTEPAKKIAGFEIFFASIAIIVAVAKKRYRS